MRKPVQKNHNKANSKEIHAPHPSNKKKHRFHPLKQDKIGTIIFQFHFTDPSQTPHRPLTDPSDPLQTQQTSVRFNIRRAKP